jgi:pyruvate formate lyase activating enzyme
MTDIGPTPPSTLRRARDIAHGHGLQFVYCGNVHDAESGTTSCPSCGTPVIVRDWYVLGRYALDDAGRCAACGHPLPGVYDGPAGTWGARREPVRLRGGKVRR